MNVCLTLIPCPLGRVQWDLVVGGGVFSGLALMSISSINPEVPPQRIRIILWMSGVEGNDWTICQEDFRIKYEDPF